MLYGCCQAFDGPSSRRAGQNILGGKMCALDRNSYGVTVYEVLGEEATGGAFLLTTKQAMNVLIPGP